MKKFVIFTLCLVTLAGLSACRTTADTRTDRYSIDLDNHRERHEERDRYEYGPYNGDGRFCPPGQGKKGNC